MTSSWPTTIQAFLSMKYQRIKFQKGNEKKKKKTCTCTHIERLLTENKDIRILWVRLKAKEKEFTGK